MGRITKVLCVSLPFTTVEGIDEIASMTGKRKRSEVIDQACRELIHRMAQSIEKSRASK